MKPAALKPSQCALPAVNQMSEIFSNKLHYGAFQRNEFFSIVLQTVIISVELLVTKLVHSPLHSLSEPNEKIKGLHCIPAGGEKENTQTDASI